MDEQPDLKKIHRARSGRVPSEEILSPVWHVPPPWHMDVFTDLEALRTPYY